MRLVAFFASKKFSALFSSINFAASFFPQFLTPYLFLQFFNYSHEDLFWRIAVSRLAKKNRKVSRRLPPERTQNYAEVSTGGHPTSKPPHPPFNVGPRSGTLRGNCGKFSTSKISATLIGGAGLENSGFFWRGGRGKHQKFRF